MAMLNACSHVPASNPIKSELINSNDCMVHNYYIIMQMDNIK